MSPDIEPVSDRTAVCAPDSEHGAVAEQVVPVPDGEAWRVVVAAEAEGATATVTATVNVATANTDLHAAEDEDANTGSP
jgi:hypothetical protein